MGVSEAKSNRHYGSGHRAITPRKFARLVGHPLKGKISEDGLMQKRSGGEQSKIQPLVRARNTGGASTLLSSSEVLGLETLVK